MIKIYLHESVKTCPFFADASTIACADWTEALKADIGNTFICMCVGSKFKDRGY